jgi:hypothetical protein
MTSDAPGPRLRAIAENDPHTRGIVVLGLGASEAELAASFAAAARQKLVRGFAVGRTIFADVAAEWMAGGSRRGGGDRVHGRDLRAPLRGMGRGPRAGGGGRMSTIRLTAAQAMVRYIAAQMTEEGEPFIAGVWAIFGHGNVAGLGEALHGARDACRHGAATTSRPWRTPPSPMPSSSGGGGRWR